MASRRCLDPTARKVKDCPRVERNLREGCDMSSDKPTHRGPREDARAPVSRRAFLSRGAAGVGAAAFGSVATEDAKAQVAIKWDLSADVIIVGAGVAGLPAAITAR